MLNGLSVFCRFQGVIQYRYLFLSGSVKLGEGRSFLGSCATSFPGMFEIYSLSCYLKHSCYLPVGDGL